MKNCPTLFFLLVVARVLHAQDPAAPGKFALGGWFQAIASKNGSAYYDVGTALLNPSTSDTKGFRLTVSPYLVKSVNPRFMLGIQGSYLLSKSTREDLIFVNEPDFQTYKLKATELGLSAFSRHNLNSGRAVALFVQPEMGFRFSQSRIEIDDVEVQKIHTWILDLGMGAGLSYALSDRWRALVRTRGLQFNYGVSKDKESGESKDFNRFDALLNFTGLSLGVEMML